MGGRGTRAAASSRRLAPSAPSPRPGDEEREEEEESTSGLPSPSSSSGTEPARGGARGGGRGPQRLQGRRAAGGAGAAAAVRAGGTHSLRVRRSASTWAAVGRPCCEKVAAARSKRNWRREEARAFEPPPFSAAAALTALLPLAGRWAAPSMAPCGAEQGRGCQKVAAVFAAGRGPSAPAQRC